MYAWNRQHSRGQGRPANQGDAEQVLCKRGAECALWRFFRRGQALNTMFTQSRWATSAEFRVPKLGAFGESGGGAAMPFHFPEYLPVPHGRGILMYVSRPPVLGFLGKMSRTGFCSVTLCRTDTCGQRNPSLLE